MGDKKSQVVIHVRERRIHNFRRHEVGKDFLHPDVIEPLHCDQVTKPHVGCLVRDDARATKHLILGRRLVQQDR